jgi:glutamate formiminotransferase/formiminotetrahydrofolate cyclodeaminase
MTPIVECVPNFSNGRDPAVVDAIVAAIASASGVTVLDVDPGVATNRTVVTFVGSPEAAVEGAFRGIARAAALIDMAEHSGAHPRQGATDVCPFVPVSGITMEECVVLAQALGRRVGDELGIPVYLYEAAASRPERQNLATVRSGEYEALPTKLGTAEWAPDFGPNAWSEAVARTGVTVIGARPFLIAYNINLNTRDRRKAMKLAALLREKGIYRKTPELEIIRDADGNGIRDPGLFKEVKGIGWYIEEYGRCQISLNLTNFHVSPVHEVYDAARRLADEEGVVVTGSELVGLIPLEALVMAGRHYLDRQGVNPGVPESVVVETAIQSLGLRELSPFDAGQRIIERRTQTDGRLVRMTGRDFVDTLASDAPAPGGGSVAALCGAMSAGLSAMVGLLTSEKREYRDVADEMRALSVEAQQLKEGYLHDIDADTEAFDVLMDAFGLPKKTDEDKKARRAAIRAATIGAIEVPLRVLERTVRAVELVDVATRGNANARSDAGVAALAAEAAAEGAYYNVLINLKGFRDPQLGPEFRRRADAAFERVLASTGAVRERVRAELRG